MSDDELTGGAALVAALETLPPVWPRTGTSSTLRMLMDGTGSLTLADVLRLNLDTQLTKNRAPQHTGIGSGLWILLDGLPAIAVDEDMLPAGW